MASSVFVKPGIGSFSGGNVIFTGSVTGATFLAGDGTTSAPSYAFASQATTGMWLPATSSIGFSLAGTEYVRFEGGNGNLRLRQASALEFASSGMNTPDVTFRRAGVGHAQVTTGLGLEKRANAALTTDGNVTYSAAEVLGGVITRSAITANRVDAFPTAANLVAAIPLAVVGTSFPVLVNNNDDASTVTVNGASAGVTYEGAATALAAGDAWLFWVFITNVTAASEAYTVYQVAK